MEHKPIPFNGEPGAVCILDGTTTNDTFKIEFSRKAPVHEMKTLIWEKIKSQCNDTDHVSTASDLVLWRVHHAPHTYYTKPISAKFLRSKKLLGEGDTFISHLNYEYMVRDHYINILIDRARVKSPQTLKAIAEQKKEYEHSIATAQPPTLIVPLSIVDNMCGWQGGSNNADGRYEFKISVRASGKLPTKTLSCKLNPTTLTVNDLKNYVCQSAPDWSHGHGYEKAHFCMVYPKGIVPAITEDKIDRACTDERLRTLVQALAKIPAMRTLTVLMDMTYTTKTAFKDLKPSDANFLFNIVNQGKGDFDQSDLGLFHEIYMQAAMYEKDDPISPKSWDSFKAAKASLLRDLDKIRQVIAMDSNREMVTTTYAALVLTKAIEVFEGDFLLKAGEQIQGPYGEGTAELAIAYKGSHNTTTTTTIAASEAALHRPLVAVTIAKGQELESALSRNMFLTHATLSDQEVNGARPSSRRKLIDLGFTSYPKATFGIVTNGKIWMILSCVNVMDNAQKCCFRSSVANSIRIDFENENSLWRDGMTEIFTKIVWLLHRIRSGYVDVNPKEESGRGDASRVAVVVAGTKRKNNMEDGPASGSPSGAKAKVHQ
ncbi:hypothetical protein BGZ83_009336 [Gryganskiella cystojenkinii]|nr:hypothetical protein BGZ83_009336 [Gryganskiella cystojenkinii]